MPPTDTEGAPRRLPLSSQIYDYLGESFSCDLFRSYSCIVLTYYHRTIIFLNTKSRDVLPEDTRHTHRWSHDQAPKEISAYYRCISRLRMM